MGQVVKQRAGLIWITNRLCHKGAVYAVTRKVRELVRVTATVPQVDLIFSQCLHWQGISCRWLLKPSNLRICSVSFSHASEIIQCLCIWAPNEQVSLNWVSLSNSGLDSDDNARRSSSTPNVPDSSASCLLTCWSWSTWSGYTPSTSTRACSRLRVFPARVVILLQRRRHQRQIIAV